MKEIRIESGVPPAELEAYFAGLAPHRNGKTYWGVNWSVTLESQTPRKLGKLLLPVTLISIQAESELGQALAAAYRLKFLSAGG